MKLKQLALITTPEPRLLVLQPFDAGTVQDKIVSGDWFVIAGSGTQELTGLRGEGGFRANLGENAQVHLDYWFE